MGKKSTSSATSAHYEYRVWGKFRSAKKRLGHLSDTQEREEFDDLYLLVDDPTMNAKVRDSGLKVKRLVGVERGFECWTSERYGPSDLVPEPYADLLSELHDGPGTDSVDDLAQAVAELDPDLGPTPVLVTKVRRRFRIGTMKAEVTDVDIDGVKRVRRTLAIEGPDLAELVKLRRKLGIKGNDNVAMHVAIDAAV